MGEKPEMGNQKRKGNLLCLLGERKRAVSFSFHFFFVRDRVANKKHHGRRMETNFVCLIPHQGGGISVAIHSWPTTLAEQAVNWCKEK